MRVPESDEVAGEELSRIIDGSMIDWMQVVRFLRRDPYCPACLDEHDSLVCPEVAASEAQG